jgi:hypothetical protein
MHKTNLHSGLNALRWPTHKGHRPNRPPTPIDPNRARHPLWTSHKGSHTTQPQLRSQVCSGNNRECRAIRPAHALTQIRHMPCVSRDAAAGLLKAFTRESTTARGKGGGGACLGEERGVLLLCHERSKPSTPPHCKRQTLNLPHVAPHKP